MWLEHLQLRGFRAFADAEIELPRAGLVLIIGANNSGKSTLLGAMDALRGIMPDQPLSNTAVSDPARLEYVELSATRHDGQFDSLAQLVGPADGGSIEAVDLNAWLQTQRSNVLF